MSLASSIARFNRKLEQQMTATAHVDRPVGEPVWDADEETTVQQYDRIYTDRPCKPKSDARDLRKLAAAETEVDLSDRTIKFDQDTDVRVDDIITITSSVYDPLDVGMTYRVVVVDRREWQIGRVVGVEEQHVQLLNGGD